MKELSVFPTGEKNTAYAKYFIGQSYLYPLSTEQVHISNVTFEPGCRNNWHVHTAKKGGGQILICTPSQCREKNAATNGSNLYLTKITASLTD